MCPQSTCVHDPLNCTKHKHICTVRLKKVDTYTTGPFRLARIFCSQWSLSACPWVILHTLSFTPGNSDAIITYITSTYSGKHCLVLYRQRLLCKHIKNLLLSTHPISCISVCVNDNLMLLLHHKHAASALCSFKHVLSCFQALDFHSVHMLLVGPSL